MTKGKWTDKVQASDFDRMVKRGLTAVGIMLEGAAISNAMQSVRTGRLRGSITYALKGFQTNMRSPHNVPEDKMDKPIDKYTLYIGTNVDYAQHVEYGTRHMGAKSYMRPALDENRKEARKLFREEIKKVLRGQ